MGRILIDLRLETQYVSKSSVPLIKCYSRQFSETFSHRMKRDVYEDIFDLDFTKS